MAEFFRPVYFPSNRLCRRLWYYILRSTSALGARGSLWRGSVLWASGALSTWGSMEVLRAPRVLRGSSRVLGADGLMWVLLATILTSAHSDRTFLEFQKMVVKVIDAWAEDERGFPEFLPGFWHWERAHFNDWIYRCNFEGRYIGVSLLEWELGEGRKEGYAWTWRSGVLIAWSLFFQGKKGATVNFCWNNSRTVALCENSETSLR